MTNDINERDKLAQAVAIAQMNYALKEKGSVARARVPVLQDGIHALPPYYEICDISGVSLHRPNARHNATTDAIHKRFTVKSKP